METEVTKLDAESKRLHEMALARAYAHPVAFAQTFLDDDVWETQRDILEALAQPNARVAVKGCHSSSKTFLGAEYLLWFISRFHDGIAITTAPGERQVDKVTWGEIHKARARSKVHFPPANVAELKVGTGNYAVGFPVSKGDEAVRVQGYKAPHLFFLLDEAPGIPMEVLNAIEGGAAGNDVRILLIGNPTIASGWFHDIFTTHRSTWTCFSIDAYDTPNFATLWRLAKGEREQITELLRVLPEDHPAIQYEPRPYLATPRWARARLLEWGTESPLWQSRVRAQFPEQGEDALISLKWLEAAKNREISQVGLKLSVGIDVAGPGEDETVIVARSGPNVIDWHAWPQQDPRGEVLAFLAPYKQRIVEVNVDSAGIGYYFAQHLRDNGYRVNEVNVGEKPRDPERYNLLKAELYWGLRQRFQDGDIAGLTDETTISQLASIRYRHNPRGQVEIESKDDARKRGVKSPDRAEAWMLAFADMTPGIIAFYRDSVERERDANFQQPGDNPKPPSVEDGKIELGDLAQVYEREMERLNRGR